MTRKIGPLYFNENKNASSERISKFTSWLHCWHYPQGTAWTVKKLTQYVNKKKLVPTNFSHYNGIFQIVMPIIDFVNVYDRPGGGANISSNPVLHKI